MPGRKASCFCTALAGDSAKGRSQRQASPLKRHNAMQLHSLSGGKGLPHGSVQLRIEQLNLLKHLCFFFNCLFFASKIHIRLGK